MCCLLYILLPRPTLRHPYRIFVQHRRSLGSKCAVEPCYLIIGSTLSSSRRPTLRHSYRIFVRRRHSSGSECTVELELFCLHVISNFTTPRTGSPSLSLSPATSTLQLSAVYSTHTFSPFPHFAHTFICCELFPTLYRCLRKPGTYGLPHHTRAIVNHPNLVQHQPHPVILWLIQPSLHTYSMTAHYLRHTHLRAKSTKQYLVLR